MSVRKIDAMPTAWAGAAGSSSAATGGSSASAVPGALTLYSDITDFSSASIKIVADLCGIHLNNKPLAQSPQKSKDPVLVADGKTLVGAPAITSYLARISGEKDSFLGASPFEEAQVNQFVSITTSTVLPAV